jgi:hypothetical protein
MKLYIIFRESGMLLSKKSYGTWREIQDEYSDYKASLGPWSPDEILGYLEDDYSTLEPRAAVQIRELISRDGETHQLTFKDAC